MMIIMITSILMITKMMRKNIPISNQALLRAGFMVEQAKSATARVSIHHFSITILPKSITAPTRGLHDGNKQKSATAPVSIHHFSITGRVKSIDNLSTFPTNLSTPCGSAWHGGFGKRAAPSAEALTFPSTPAGIHHRIVK